MTARELKIKTFSLIEEYYPDKDNLADDDDVKYKINGVINSVLSELSRIKKIPTKTEITITKENNTKVINEIESLYQINKIVCDSKFDIVGDYEIVFELDDDKESDVATIYYYKYPERMDLEFEAEDGLTKEKVSDEYDEGFEFELSDDVLEIAPYGIASDLLKQDMISNYGKYFYERYQQLKQELDMRIAKPTVTITGGIDI